MSFHLTAIVRIFVCAHTYRALCGWTFRSLGTPRLELKPCEHRSLGMDEFVVLAVAETCVTSYSVLSNHTTVFQGID